jgi:ligand-binding SRPBCC domain-containing protein
MFTISAKDGGYRLMSEQWFPRPRSEIFAFFAQAENLERVTPPWLRFSIATPTPIEMRVGTVIEYRIKVLALTMGWRSEILEWEPPHQFVDNQIKGPYRRWHHRHLFEERDGGTLTRDVVDYCVPGGRLIHALLVRRDVERIFGYRQQVLGELFGGLPKSD